MVGAVLKGEGIPVENCVSTDRPDIIVPLNGNEAIGIEVVTYRPTDNAENESALYRILSEYGCKIDEESDVRYEVTVSFHGAELPSGLNFKKIKELLFSEMDNCRFELPEMQFNKYIASVSTCELSGLKKTHVGLCAAFFFEDIDERYLHNIILKKEVKLQEYKAVKRDINIIKWWLVIFFPTIEHTDFRKYSKAVECCTLYDQIFLTEPGDSYIKLL